MEKIMSGARTLLQLRPPMPRPLSQMEADQYLCRSAGTLAGLSLGLISSAAWVSFCVIKGAKYGRNYYIYRCYKKGLK
jgi:hypothetical protein